VTDTLEPKITAALNDQAAESAALAALIQETEAALTEADKGVEEARIKALDLSTDPAKALAAQQAVELKRDRLRGALPKLREGYRGTVEAERQAAWLERAKELEIERNAIAKTFFELYPALVSQLVRLFERTIACDKAVNAHNYDLPAGVMSVPGLAEWVGLANMVKLPNYMGGPAAWPPQQQPDFTPLYAQVAQFSAGPGDFNELHRQAALDTQRMLEWHRQRDKERQAREAQAAAEAVARQQADIVRAGQEAQETLERARAAGRV
jgi:hypothetical protein